MTAITKSQFYSFRTSVLGEFFFLENPFAKVYNKHSIKAL